MGAHEYGIELMRRDYSGARCGQTTAGGEQHGYSACFYCILLLSTEDVDMGPMSYALCQKPMIGIAMFITGLCAFPPLIRDEPLVLTRAGSAVAKEFVVQIDKPYTFDLSIEFPSIEALNRDQVLGVGDANGCQADVKGEDPPAGLHEQLGHPIPIHVLIRRKADRRVAVDQTFLSRCNTGWSGREHPIIWREIGRVDLTRGEYIAEVTNLEAQPGLAGAKTAFWLVGGHGK